jgi:hypothetical protein
LEFGDYAGQKSRAVHTAAADAHFPGISPPPGGQIFAGQMDHNVAVLDEPFVEQILRWIPKHLRLFISFVARADQPDDFVATLPQSRDQR